MKSKKLVSRTIIILITIVVGYAITAFSPRIFRDQLDVEPTSCDLSLDGSCFYRQEYSAGLPFRFEKYIASVEISEGRTNETKTIEEINPNLMILSWSANSLIFILFMYTARKIYAHYRH